MLDYISRRQFVKTTGGFLVGAAAAGSAPLIDILTANAQNNTGYKVVGYFENWSQYRLGGGKFLPDQIDASLFTHINFAFGIFGFITRGFTGGPRLTGDYKIQPVEWNDQTVLYPAIQKLKVKNPSLKTLLSIGGWSFNDASDVNKIGTFTYNLFSQMVASSAGRQEFISSAIDYARKYNFDGIDLDWEYPGYTGRGGKPEDLPNFLALVKEFRTAISGKNLLFTMASPAIALAQYRSKPQDYFKWLAQCAQSFDWLNVMSYDYHGAFPDDKVTGVNAPLLEDSTPGGPFSVKNTVEAYLEAGIPPSKIVLGMPTYGRSFKVSSPLSLASNGPGKPYSSAGPAGPATAIPGILSYYEIADRIASGNLKRGWHEPTLTPYAYSSQTNEWITYDDVESIGYKTSYLIRKKLAGSMFWAIGLDGFQKGFPLMKQAKDIQDHPEKIKSYAMNEGDSINKSFSGGNQYDVGVNSAIAVNDSNIVVEVHKSEGSKNNLWYRAGRVNAQNQIIWADVNNKGDKSGSYNQGDRPSVAINNNGLVVEVHETGFGEIYYHVAQVKPDKPNNWVEFSPGIQYDKGVTPSVAINDDGLVVEVHRSGGLSNALWYRIGQVEGDKITWRNGGKSIQYDSGVAPSVAVRNDGLVVEVHNSEGLKNGLWYRIGQIDGDTITWKNSNNSIQYDTGVRPSITIRNDGLVVEVHKSEVLSNALWYRTGKVEGDKITWQNSGKSIQYAYGLAPKVTCNGELAVETHGSSEGSGLFYSVLKLPSSSTSGQLDWIEARGQNSYIYYEFDNSLSKGKKVDTSKTIKVDFGAPFVYAVLFKNFDSSDFPTGAKLTIKGPNGTVYNRESNTDKLLVTMSGASLRVLVIKDPLPGDYQITLNVPQNTEFHFKFHTLPSKNVNKTIEDTIAAAYKTSSVSQKLQKRSLDLGTAISSTSMSGLVGVLMLSGGIAVPPVAVLEFIVAAGISLVAIYGLSTKSNLRQSSEILHNSSKDNNTRETVFGKDGYQIFQNSLLKIINTLTKTNVKKPNSNSSIRVATWNIGTRFILDGQVVTNTDPKLRMSLFAENAAFIGVDIIAFQEAPNNLTQNQINAIVGGTGYSWQYVNMEYPTGTGRANNRGTAKAYLVLYKPEIVTRNTTLNFFSINNFVDLQTGYQCRPPVKIDFNVVNPTLKKQIPKIYFLTWHNEESPRQLSAFLLYRLSELVKIQSNVPGWIVAGDFNWANVDKITDVDTGGRIGMPNPNTKISLFSNWQGISGGTTRGVDGNKDHILANVNCVEVAAGPTFESDAGHLALIADIYK